MCTHTQNVTVAYLLLYINAFSNYDAANVLVKMSRHRPVQCFRRASTALYNEHAVYVNVGIYERLKNYIKN